MLDILVAVRPDIAVLQDIDYDSEGVALAAFADALEERGLNLPHRFALRPNTGRTTGLDLDGDGRLGGPRDAQGYGRFAGAGGMAILSAFPIDAGAARDFSAMLWADLPDADLTDDAGGLILGPEAATIQRLSTTAHWDVPVILPTGSRLHILTFHATPPVFDGPDDRNGRRNGDEIRFWSFYLDGTYGPPPERFVIAGDFNNDIDEGEGRKDPLRALLDDPRLQDPRPTSEGAVAAGGDPDDTVDWRGVDAGIMRVDYLLPASNLTVTNAGVFWPAPKDADAALLGKGGTGISRHRLVWVDIALP